MTHNETGFIIEIPVIFKPDIDQACILSRSDNSLDSPGEIRGSGCTPGIALRWNCAAVAGTSFSVIDKTK